MTGPSAHSSISSPSAHSLSEEFLIKLNWKIELIKKNGQWLVRCIKCPLKRWCYGEHVVSIPSATSLSLLYCLKVQMVAYLKQLTHRKM